MDDWEKWLNSEQTHRIFTSSQIEKARCVILYVPKCFGIPPSAMPDEDENLCLSWRCAPWTLSLEINSFGETEWFVFNTETHQSLEGYENITSYFRLQEVLDSVRDTGVTQEGWVSKSEDGTVGIEWKNSDRGFLVLIEESLTWVGFDEFGFYDFENLDQVVSWFLGEI